MNVRKILVVDDDQNIAELLAYVLRREGHTVHLASSVESALLTLTQLRVDVVLTDYMMPVSDGAELIRTMRGMPGLATIPVLVLSAAPEEIVRIHCRDMAKFLRKPFQVEDLLGSVGSFLGRSAPPAAPDQPLGGGAAPPASLL